MKTRRTMYESGNVRSLIKIDINTVHVMIYFDRAGRPLKTRANYRDGVLHGKHEEYDLDGTVVRLEYWLDGEKVSMKEFRKHELIEQLAGLDD